ncbi:hypothetical protein L596_030371 [Steinernema carpocapsae]|uniref:Uncharacterized protein n=1 Tax=Steinernema carpocapsae TaxID=34508 RepID=A0A4U5LP89_STECR|nr:hypothetical protein L596_030371 [Steinernema carpocapsae]
MAWVVPAMAPRFLRFQSPGLLRRLENVLSSGPVTRAMATADQVLSFPYVAPVLAPAAAVTAAVVAAPVIIPAAAGALGFGTGGIAAGSTAATMMSWGRR